MMAALPGRAGDDAARSLRDPFLHAMRQLAGGVCAITVGTGAERRGFVATSVTSLSAEPPSLLVAVNRSSSAWPAIGRFRHFGASVLAQRHLPLAQQLSGRTGAQGEHRFTGAAWHTGETGAPLLSDAVAAIDCDVEDIIERHSHGIIIGRVRAVTPIREEAPLIYLRGGYASLGAPQPG